MIILHRHPTASGKPKGEQMGKQKAVKAVKADKALLAAVSYGEQDGFAVYTATELEAQDKRNTAQLAGLDNRFPPVPEYAGTNFEKMRKEALEESKDPNERFCFYPDKQKITKTGTIISKRTAKCYTLRMDGDKKPFLFIGGEDIITIGIDLPLMMKAPTGIEFTILKYRNVGSLMIKGASKEMEVSFLTAKTSAVWFGYTTTDPLPETPTMVNFG